MDVVFGYWGWFVNSIGGVKALIALALLFPFSMANFLTYNFFVAAKGKITRVPAGVLIFWLVVNTVVFYTWWLMWGN